MQHYHVRSTVFDGTPALRRTWGLRGSHSGMPLGVWHVVYSGDPALHSHSDHAWNRVVRSTEVKSLLLFITVRRRGPLEFLRGCSVSAGRKITTGTPDISPVRILTSQGSASKQ
jgi:hypothetical protein